MAVTAAEVIALRRRISRGGSERTALLREGCDRPVRGAKALREWRDLLLFVVAHPRDAEELTLAERALERIAGTTAEDPVEGSYTLALVRWMLLTFPGCVALSQVDAPLDDVRDVLRTLVLPVEEELVDWAAADADELLGEFFGGSPERRLTLLVLALDALQASERVRESLFARLRAFVRIDADGSPMRDARIPSGTTHFLADGALRTVDAPSIASMPAPARVRLGRKQSCELIDTARTVLAAMARETDPITQAGAVELFDMGRGLRIALFALDAAHRLAFDSYVGFMAFRNGVPLGYGGAWIFPGRSKIGINVFPSQRGGESAWFFAQLLRLYRAQFRVDRFEAENYQLGHGNAEGLRSGAYWFYYRLGFRPMTPQLRVVAERESQLLMKRAGYVVPRKVLLALVEEGLELTLDHSGRAPMDTTALTEAVRALVSERYDSDRERAMTAAMRRVRTLLRQTTLGGDPRRWSADEEHIVRLWALPLDLIDDLEQWSLADRRRLAALLSAKAGVSETRHQRLLTAHRRLLAGWERALVPGAVD